MRFSTRSSFSWSLRRQRPRGPKAAPRSAKQLWCVEPSIWSGASSGRAEGGKGVAGILVKKGWCLDNDLITVCCPENRRPRLPLGSAGGVHASPCPLTWSFVEQGQASFGQLALFRPRRWHVRLSPGNCFRSRVSGGESSGFRWRLGGVRGFCHRAPLAPSNQLFTLSSRGDHLWEAQGIFPGSGCRCWK